jgi:hypothetical protein
MEVQIPNLSSEGVRPLPDGLFVRRRKAPPRLENFFARRPRSSYRVEFIHNVDGSVTIVLTTAEGAGVALSKFTK